jgi:hypothetical protein
VKRKEKITARKEGKEIIRKEKSGRRREVSTYTGIRSSA